MGKPANPDHLTRVCERVAAPFSGCRVDRDKGVIYGALICGSESKNGRDYPRGSFGDGRQYAGRHVYLDHSHGKPRRAEDKVGWFGEDIRFRADGTPEGDFHVLKSHRMADVILEAAERNPSLFGFSHIALIKEKPAGNGRMRVESVKEVDTIDLVPNPATTNGIYESVQHGGSGVKTTLREVIESLRARLPADRQPLARKFLLVAEDDAGMGAMMDAPVDAPAAETDPDAALLDGFKQAIDAVWQQYADDKDAAAAVKKIGQYIKAHARLTKGDADGGEGGKDGDKTTPESVQKPAGPDPWDVLTECKAAGYEPTPTQLKVLARTPDKAERLAFVAESKQLLAEGRRVAEKPRGAGRHGAAPVAEADAGKDAGGKTVEESAALAWWG